VFNTQKAHLKQKKKKKKIVWQKQIENALLNVQKAPKWPKRTFCKNLKMNILLKKRFLT
jgi:hypothetical protein